MIDRRTFVRAGALATAGWPLVTAAQKASAIPRIGLLVVVPSAVDAAFVAGLRELGYVDGRNVAIERRSADGDYGRLPSLAAELVALRPSVIASVVTQASIAAKDATSTIPIVIVAVSDPVAAGIVGNLSRPGGNVTGTAVHLHDAVGKQVELMRQVLPRLARIAVIWNPDNAVFQQQSLGEALISAARMRVVAQPLGVRSREDIERTFASLSSERVDGVLVLQDPLVSAHRARIAELAAAHRLPAFSGFRLLTEAGILASYGPDLRVSGKRASVYVQRILKGARPSDLPIELPTRLELVVNARTADALGIALSPAVLARADEVIR
jgi:putative ABC transport system substrate-binding protein